MGRPEVFVDTQAYVALANLDDPSHDRAVEVTAQLRHTQARLVTTRAILIEVGNFFRQVSSRKCAIRIIEAALEDHEAGLLEIVSIDDDLWQKGWQLFTDRPDKDWGLTDCLSFALMRNRGMQAAFTCDHHYEQAGFQLLLPRT